MKKLVFLFALISSSLFAEEHMLPGKVFYKMKDGSIVKRMMTLKVVKEEGKKSEWYLTTDEKSYKADMVFKRMKYGQKQVTLIFHSKDHEIVKGKKGTFILKGTVLKGTDNGVFWGKTLIATKPGMEKMPRGMWKWIDFETASAFLKGFFRQVGGFAFKKGEF